MTWCPSLLLSRNCDLWLITARASAKNKINSFFVPFSRESLHAGEYWGFDSVEKQYVAFVFDNFGGARKFTSSGWAGDTLIWLGETLKSNPPTLERFVYKRDGPNGLVVNWEVKKGTGDWIVGDTLTCKR